MDQFQHHFLGEALLPHGIRLRLKHHADPIFGRHQLEVEIVQDQAEELGEPVQGDDQGARLHDAEREELQRPGPQRPGEHAWAFVLHARHDQSIERRELIRCGARLPGGEQVGGDASMGQAGLSRVVAQASAVEQLADEVDGDRGG